MFATIFKLKINNMDKTENELKEKTLQDLNKLISDYFNYKESFSPIDLKILAENCIKLINKDF
jgi:hypothetical protein